MKTKHHRAVTVERMVMEMMAVMVLFNQVLMVEAVVEVLVRQGKMEQIPMVVTVGMVMHVLYLGQKFIMAVEAVEVFSLDLMQVMAVWVVEVTVHFLVLELLEQMN